MRVLATLILSVFVLLPLLALATPYGQTFGGGSSGIQRFEWRLRTDDVTTLGTFDCLSAGSGDDFACADAWDTGGPPQTSGSPDGFCDVDGSTAVDEVCTNDTIIFTNRWSGLASFISSNPTLVRAGCYPMWAIQAGDGWGDATNTPNIPVSLWGTTRSGGSPKVQLAVPTFTASSTTATPSHPAAIEINQKFDAALGITDNDAEGMLLWRLGYLGYSNDLTHPDLDSTNCVGSGDPVACCTGAGTGTCVVDPVFDIVCYVDIRQD